MLWLTSAKGKNLSKGEFDKVVNYLIKYITISK